VEKGFRVSWKYEKKGGIMAEEFDIHNAVIKQAEEMGFYTPSVKKAFEFILEEICRLKNVEKSSDEALSALNCCDDFYGPKGGDASLKDIFSVIDKAMSKLDKKEEMASQENLIKDKFNLSYEDFKKSVNDQDINKIWSQAINRSNSVNSFDFSSSKNEQLDDYMALADIVKDWSLSDLVSMSMKINSGDDKIKEILKNLYEKGYIKLN
jgi:hypothetical protein